jgi:hypothetical protein
MKQAADYMCFHWRIDLICIYKFGNYDLSENLKAMKKEEIP